MSQIATWKAHIARLARLDPTRRVFGASSHNYALQPVSEADVVEFESWCVTRLPESYRDYLLHIGRPVGPYYGLMSFKEIRDELALIYEDYIEQLSARGRPGDPFALDEAMERGIVGAEPPPVDGFECPATPGGFIPICTQGCEFLAVLVTSGKSVGRVFDTTGFADSASDWRSAQRPPGIVETGKQRAALPSLRAWPTFAEWIDAWLEQCFADLKHVPATSQPGQFTRVRRQGT
jgi:hypothetical protein